MEKIYSLDAFFYQKLNLQFLLQKHINFNKSLQIYQKTDILSLKNVPVGEYLIQLTTQTSLFSNMIRFLKIETASKIIYC